jgi:hypothetical protein
MNTGDDVPDRLFAAFGTHLPATPQLLVDAHAEIVALRRQLAAETARADDTYERLVDRDRQLNTVRIEYAAAIRAHRAQVDELTAQIEAERAHHRATRALAREHRRHTAVYRAAVAPLAEEIRRARAATSASVLAPTEVDTRLALKAMKTIARANEQFDRRQHRAAEPAQLPERMTA